MDVEKLRRLHGEEYVRRFEREQSLGRIARLLPLMRLSREHRLIDLGCGTGMIVPLIAKQVAEYVGIDFSQEFITAAQSRHAAAKYPNVSFECADIIEFAELHAGGFDVALALDLAEHVPDNLWRPLLDATRKMLRPGGTFYLHTPNREFFLERLKANNFILKQFPEHVAVRKEGHHHLLLQAAGFNVARSSIIAHYNLMRVVHPLRHLPACRGLFGARIFIEAMTPP